jgi:hypothetical protein
MMKRSTKLYNKYQIPMTRSTAASLMRTLNATLLMISLAGAAVLLCGGCGKSGPAAPGAAEIQAFDKATPEIKDIWQAALSADRTNDYAKGITLYFALMREEITPEQQAVVAKASTGLKQRMDDAAAKGDAAAQAALQELRQHAPGRPR